MESVRPARHCLNAAGDLARLIERPHARSTRAGRVAFPRAWDGHPGRSA